jgi:hypothetical protein
MSRQNPMVELHHNAAKYLEHAAKHHKLAAEHFARGELDKGARHAHLAHGNTINGMYYQGEASKSFTTVNPDGSVDA